MSEWILDFGASVHASPHKEWFTTYVPTKDFFRLKTCDILGVGDVQLKFQNGATLVFKNFEPFEKDLGQYKEAQ